MKLCLLLSFAALIEGKNMEIMSLCLRNTWYFSNKNVTGTILLYNAKRKKKIICKTKTKNNTCVSYLLQKYFNYVHNTRH